MIKNFQTIVLAGRSDLAKHRNYFQKLVSFLKSQGKNVFLCVNIAKILKAKAATPNQARKADLVLIFGGDGTFLSVVRKLFKARGAFAGIKLEGTLGFLTEYTPEKLKQNLARFFEGKFEIKERIILKAEIYRQGKLFKKLYALNETTISQNGIARLVEIDFLVNKKRLATFHSDGAIVATPTGSTAYSLSAGGPILDPDLQALILTPINPHLLTVRPLVLPATEKIRAKISNSKHILTIDGQVNLRLKRNDEVVFQKSKWPLKVIHCKNRNHFAILRKKLNWAERS